MFDGATDVNVDKSWNRRLAAFSVGGCRRRGNLDLLWRGLREQGLFQVDLASVEVPQFSHDTAGRHEYNNRSPTFTSV
jgi:hypothetical protein